MNPVHNVLKLLYPIHGLRAAQDRKILNKVCDINERGSGRK